MNKNQQEHLKNETIKRKEEFMTRRTKIICTLGPSTDNEAVMRALIEEGMNVARFNFSHGPHDEQMGRLKMLRKLRKELGKYVAALLDTKGPEIRLVEFEKGKTELKTGQTFTLTTDDILGTDERVSITYKNLADDVKPGDHILIDDGLVGLEVVEIKPVAKPVNTKVNARDIVCKVLNDGVISNKKGVNVPNVDLTMPFISEKDYGDICFAVKMIMILSQLPLSVPQRMLWKSAKSLQKKAARILRSFPRSRTCRVSAISMTLFVCPTVSWWRVETWGLKSR